MEPCGTPERTLETIDSSSPIRTTWVLSERKDAIHRRALDEIELVMRSSWSEPVINTVEGGTEIEEKQCGHLVLVECMEGIVIDFQDR